jgi:hypothetical protein
MRRGEKASTMKQSGARTAQRYNYSAQKSLPQPAKLFASFPQLSSQLFIKC